MTLRIFSVMEPSALTCASACGWVGGMESPRVNDVRGCNANGLTKISQTHSPVVCLLELTQG